MYFNLSLKALIDRVKMFGTAEGQQQVLYWFQEYCEQYSVTNTDYIPGFATIEFQNPETGEWEKSEISIKELLHQQITILFSNPAKITEFNRPDTGWFFQQAESLDRTLQVIQADKKLQQFGVEPVINYLIKQLKALSLGKKKGRGRKFDSIEPRLLHIMLRVVDDIYDPEVYIKRGKAKVARQLVNDVCDELFNKGYTVSQTTVRKYLILHRSF
jgi:hypothetical protein